MDAFIKYLSKYLDLKEDYTKLLKDELKSKHYKTNDYFLSAGEYSNEIGFIKEGIFRILFYDNNGDEITRYFMSENQFVVNLYAYDNQIVSGEYIQAVTASNLIIITRNAFDTLSKEIPSWDSVINKIKQDVLIEKLYNRSDLVHKDATTKYLDFLAKNPNLANRVPLGYLASYLGIKQQSLSRIRHNIATKSTI
nr:Crp/Fnr family transcriptional regulator [uncultured Draconibacterium sp.]